MAGVKTGLITGLLLGAGVHFIMTHGPAEYPWANTWTQWIVGMAVFGFVGAVLGWVGSENLDVPPMRWAIQWDEEERTPSRRRVR